MLHRCDVSSWGLAPRDGNEQVWAYNPHRLNASPVASQLHVCHDGAMDTTLPGLLWAPSLKRPLQLPVGMGIDCSWEPPAKQPRLTAEAWRPAEDLQEINAGKRIFEGDASSLTLLELQACSHAQFAKAKRRIARPPEDAMQLSCNAVALSRETMHGGGCTTPCSAPESEAAPSRGSQAWKAQVQQKMLEEMQRYRRELWSKECGSIASSCRSW
mmetsp:Transcript_46837/g.111449  ORF Transcript_46837/g.111449 Transcript_46837/m.111449 type:complete len:214 (+) Transcript_46837:65-706(+)